MSGVVTCCLQIVIGSGILYANYHFFLRNKKFHSYNRYYLLIAVVLSILIPFLNIPVHVAAGKASLVIETWTIISSADKSSVQIANDYSSAMPTLTLQRVLFCSYGLFALVFSARFVTAILLVRKLLRKYPSEQTGDVCFITTTEPDTPFSFFKWMFWNRNVDLQSPAGRQMFRHELFHIRQRHSWDIVFMEIATSFLWINPFFHLLKKELKTIHEFLADEFATKENDKWTYAELLLTQLVRSNRNSLVNHFFQSQIKRRIAMITSPTTPKYQFFRKLMILPIATLILIAFAFKVRSDSATVIPKTSRHIEKPLPADNVLIGRLTRSDQYTSDTARPRAKEKQKRKERREKDEVRQNEEGAEQKELKDLLEQKQQETQKTQQEFKELLIEKQKEAEKEQLEFKDMMEKKQREAEQKGNELFKKLMAEKQIEAQKAGDEFKRMMEEKRAASEHEGQEKFKQLLAEKQLEARKFEEEFKQKMIEREKESEKSQLELKEWIEKKRNEIEKELEEQKKMMLKQQMEKKSREDKRKKI